MGAVSPARPSGSRRPRFGEALRQWRKARRFSQLELAARADVSQRHLSFLETGRSKPSREMVVHLATMLELPLRHQNDLLVAAGFAPVYTETALDEPQMDQVRDALEFLLEAHEPYPALVIDRRWNLVLSNRAAGQLTAMMLGSAIDGPINLARLAFHPSGLRQVTVDWESTAAQLLTRLEREVNDRAADQALLALFEEVLEYPDVRPLRRRPQLPTGHDLLLPVHYRSGEIDVRLFSTIATIGAPFDITLEELRLETLFPADEKSERTLRKLAAGG